MLLAVRAGSCRLGDSRRRSGGSRIGSGSLSVNGLRVCGKLLGLGRLSGRFISGSRGRLSSLSGGSLSSRGSLISSSRGSRGSPIRILKGDSQIIIGRVSLSDPAILSGFILSGVGILFGKLSGKLSGFGGLGRNLIGATCYHGRCANAVPVVSQKAKRFKRDKHSWFPWIARRL